MVPLVSPVTVVEVAGGLPVTVTGVCAVEPMNGVTVYLVIALPPLLVGAVQLTVADPLPAVAVTPVGAPGSAFGVTALDGDGGRPGAVRVGRRHRERVAWCRWSARSPWSRWPAGCRSPSPASARSSR